MRSSYRIAFGFAVTGVLAAGCQSNGESPSSNSFSWRPAATTARDSAIRQPASPVDLQLSLARSLERDGDDKGAANAYQQILHRHPKQPVATHRLAVVLGRLQRFEDSDRLFEQAVAMAPKDPDVLCDYAYSLYSQNELPRAEELLRRSLAVAPGHIRSQNHLGLVLARTNRREEALHAFHAAGCTLAEAHENIGLVLSLDDRLAEARAEYAVAQNLAPGSESIRTRMQELDAVAADPAAVEYARSEGAPSIPEESSSTTGRAVVRLAGAESSSYDAQPGY